MSKSELHYLSAMVIVTLFIGQRILFLCVFVALL